ncbi:MAG TPA: hypothetical protein ENI23_08195 [bacterium]|nr:hypothetical protein [bacterium]
MFPRYETYARKEHCEFKDGELVELPRVTGGIDWGRRMPVIYRNENWLLVKVPGHTAWSGVGFTRYYSTRYMLVEIIEETDKKYQFNMHKDEKVVDRNWRDIQKRMKAEIDEAVEKEVK